VVAGVLSWGAAAAVGVSALLTASAVAYDALRRAGYLVSLGGRILWRLVRRRAAADAGSAPVAPGGAWRSARTGLLTNLLTPKVGAFSVSVLPPFLPPGTSALARGVLLALVHAVLSLVWFAVLVLGAVAARRWLQRPGVSRSVEGATGVALLGFGLRLALPGG
jgi:threonine/homoserine/homoserine lactone efflux protein